MSLMPPDHLFSDEDLLEHMEDTYERTRAYTKIYEGRRDLARAGKTINPVHLAEHEEDLRVYRRALAQQWRTIQLLRAYLHDDSDQAPPRGADATSPELQEAAPADVTVRDGDGVDIASLFGLGDL